MIDTSKDGGAAFPQTFMLEGAEVHFFGISIRDYFAVHASRQDVEAQAEILCAKLFKVNGIGILPDGWQVDARYMHADAMMEGRK